MTLTTRALGLCVTLAVLVSACGGSGSSGSTGGAATGAASSAASPAANGPAVGSTVKGADLASKLTTAMAASPNVSVGFESTGGDGLKGVGAVSFAADGSVLELKVPQSATSDEPMTIIQTADAVYIDGATAGLDGGKQWARISKISDKGGMFTALFALVAVGTTTFTNPDGLLRALAATPSVTVKASDASSVTYTATLSPAAGVQLLPVALFGGDKKARDQAGKQSVGDTTSELTLVTDAKGRPTSVTYQATSDGTPTTITTEYVSWGSGEVVEVPAPGTVTEAAELDKQLKP